MPADVWRVVVVPLLGREECVVLGITTPMTKRNFFSKLIGMVDPNTGEKVIMAYIMELACERCKDRNRGHLCPHHMRFLPPFKSEEKQALMNTLLSDDLETAKRENYGIMDTNCNSFIEKPFIDRWFQNPHRFVPQPGYKADTLIVAVDPNGSNGKYCSKMAITVLALKWDLMCLVGLASRATDTSFEVTDFIHSMLDAIEQEEWISEAQILLAIEGNLAHESGFIASVVRNRPRVHAICGARPGKVGIVTTSHNKPEYAHSARHHIVHGTLQIANHIVCGDHHLKYDSGSLVPPEKRGEHMLEVLEDEMRRYQRVQSSGESVINNPRSSVSGVVDSEGKRDPTLNDDVMFTLTFACRTADKARNGLLEHVAREWLPQMPASFR